MKYYEIESGMANEVGCSNNGWNSLGADYGFYLCDCMGDNSGHYDTFRGGIFAHGILFSDIPKPLADKYRKEIKEKYADRTR